MTRGLGPRFGQCFATKPLCGLLCACLIWVGQGAHADTTWYRLGFETVRLGPRTIEDNGKDYRFRREGGGALPSVSRDPVSGSSALILRSRPTPSGASRDRAEVQIYSGITWGRTWFTSLRFRIPPGPYDIADWQVLLQCPQAGTTHPPPISIDLEPDGRIALVARSERDAHDVLWDAPIPKGRWVKLTLGLRMGEAGRVQLWLDGKPQADIWQALGWHNAGEPRCVLKAGLYRAASRSPFEIRLDDITLADSYRAAQPHQ